MTDVLEIVREFVSELKAESKHDSNRSAHLFTAEKVQARFVELDGIELKEIETALRQISEAGGGIVSKGLGATGRNF